MILIGIAPCSAELSKGQLREVGLNPRPGAALPLDAAFSAGSARVSLKDALDGRPAVLVLADFKCRYTCGTALAIAADGLTHTRLEAGRDYNLLVIGINPGAGIADAEAMRATYLAPYPPLRAAAKFLNGDAAAIASVTDALGYKAVYDAQRGEFAHPLGAVILTPEGPRLQRHRGLEPERRLAPAGDPGRAGEQARRVRGGHKAALLRAQPA